MQTGDSQGRAGLRKHMGRPPCWSPPSLPDSGPPPATCMCPRSHTAETEGGQREPSSAQHPHAGRACAAPGLTSRDHPGSSTRLAPRQDMFTPCLFNSSVFVSTPEAECDFGATSPLTTLAELLPKQLYHMPRWAFDFGSLNITFLWKQALRIATPINGGHPNS